MIYGIGTDIVSIERIDTIYRKNPVRFTKKILSSSELEYFDTLSNNKKIYYLASRWSAKEALVKALGTGFRQGIYLSDISVNNNSIGKPFITISYHVENIIKSTLNLKENNYNIFLSLSHEKYYATAFVVVEVKTI